ncbi:BA14K family protein [Agrobacterium larrymoorei]|uniref:BA14K family protein n=1 Tax=Agrobacterium larrymoorei TaxID=160699 RepID=UPI00157393B3|nr:BA14K family protein [Agrobacterium larrymoorei]NTJ44897.1 BA14K family protein [Agrobacterium larrymoorei]
MSKQGKVAILLALAGSMFVSANTQSFALSALSPIDPQSAVTGQTTGNNYAASAFSNGTTGEGNSGGLLLSADEVQHVRWCAERYTSYHASDNTYASANGQRVECVSR